MGQLAREAGHHINWKVIEQQEMIKASIAAHFGNSKLLSVLICNNLIEFPLTLRQIKNCCKNQKKRLKCFRIEQRQPLVSLKDKNTRLNNHKKI
ncbi:hypothetical protein ACRPOS_001810 [Bartonella heixiaziensis]|uniref:hypothetical protein n=1 Tax=Bartonella heixiaziensis TaxID=1461000 RepID=UPI003908B98E